MTGYTAEVQVLLGGTGIEAEEVRSESQLPRRRERHLEPADQRIGGFDFLAIQGCPLSEIVGRRNSGMGRVMLPSRRLIYELEMLEAADDCIATLAVERAERIGSIVASKKSELPIHVWNAVWSGEEIEAYLSTAANPLARPAAADAVALNRIADVLARPVRSVSDAGELEQALAALRGAASAGAMVLELDLVARHLDAVALVLEGRAKPSSCRGDELRLRRIFEETYLPLQAAISDLDRRAFERLDALDRIFEASASSLAATPAAMRAYHLSRLSTSARESAWQSYRAALMRHTRAWEPSLTACGLLPADPEA